MAPRFVVATALALTLGCAVDYSDPPLPSLDDAPAIDRERDELVFQRKLRWWSAPTSQRALLYRRADGSLLLLRELWDGTAVYAWGLGTLTAVGEQRLTEALAAVDTSKPKPAPGQYACTYADTLTAVVYVDGDAYEYLGLCPPEGMIALTAVYEELVELLLECPLDPSWYEGELPLEQSACDQAN